MVRPGHLLLVVALAAAQPVSAASPLASAAFELGRAVSGESCRAESAWEDPVTKAHRFDRSFDVQCRGWTDTQSAGRLYVLASGSTAEPALDKARAGRLNCGTPVAIDVAGVGRGQVARCTDREGNFPALSVVVKRGGAVYAAEGLERFNGNLAAGLRALAARNFVPESSSVAKNGFALGNAPEPAKGSGGLAGADAATLAGRWREAVGYTVRGQNVEAREIVSRSEGRLPAGASAADRASLKLEAALSESNLGNQEVAVAQLDQAAALLASSGASPNGFLGAKLSVYRAMAALNRRDYATALASATQGYAAATALAAASETDATGSDNPLRTPAVLRELNAQPGGQRPELLRAEAAYVRGAALRQTGKPVPAAAALVVARASVSAIEKTGVETSNLQWLRSQIAVEQARALMALPKTPARSAEISATMRESVECLERVGSYAGSPLLAQRKLGYAGYLADQNDRAAALRQYDEAVTIMRQAGPSAATSGEPLEGYFKLLAAEASGDSAGAKDARAKFFLASQLVNPPLVATQIAQIQKIFEAGGSQGAVLAKTLQDLDREGRSLQAQSAALKPEAIRERERLAAAIKANDERIAEVRGQLGKDEKYLQVNDSPVTLADLQAALKPGEAYVKIVTLPRATYVLAATAARAMVYQVALSTPALTALEKQVRRSIDGHVSPTTGLIVPLVFDVEAAHNLYAALLDQAAPLLGDATALIAEPTGGMTELPLGVLVASQASVDAWKVAVTKNSRDYTNVAFLAERYDLGTSVSPRAFLIARSQPASRAPRPYVGFGNHAPPTAAELATLGTRGDLGERCAARADAVQSGYASLAPIGARELAAAAAVAGTGSELIEGEAFTDSALVAAKPGTFAQYAVVHFATHGLKEGEMGCDNPPALVTSIAPDNSSDGMLSFEKIANMQFDANLIVLSACNTAASTKVSRAIASGGFRSGAAGQSAAFNGLVRAFLTAGGRAVLTTHWAIPDTLKSRDGAVFAPSTLLIGTLFETGKKSTIAAALRQAQSDRIKQVETSHPYYWGAFAIVGDGEKFMFARAS